MIKQAWLHNLYRFWYRLYYYLFGLRIIKNPKRVAMFHRTSKCYPCKAEFHLGGERHESFLFVTLTSQTKVWVWLFYHRHFIFSNDGITWWSLPALTPLSVEISYRPSGEKVVKYELNAEFVRLHLQELEKLQFIAYD